MTNRLSFSAIKTYQECGEKYRLRYSERLRSIHPSGALLFGSAIDGALNELLLSRDLNKAKEKFNAYWQRQQINGVWQDLKTYENIVYAESDFDSDLVTFDDPAYPRNKETELAEYKKILEEKKTAGWANLSLEKRRFFNSLNWESLYTKGEVMLESYEREVLPKITKVLAVQKEHYLENSNGDKIVQYLDLIVEWVDGRYILFDNKTSSREYEADAALRSPQLISYYNGAKVEYHLDAVGFIVLSKHILKNKEKICSKCGFDGSGKRHEKCPNEDTASQKRCNGDWLVKINPKCRIDIIINKVSDTAEQLVMQSFDEANTGISNKIFSKNLNSCKNGAFQCEFYEKCWFGNDQNLVVVEKHDKR